MNAIEALSRRNEDLENQLKETGNKLAENQTIQIDELLPLLDRVEEYLSRVDQSPPKLMLNAVSLSLNALIEDRYLRHSDVDVKVAVASCISEITRITAPEAPYEDEKMKDVFQLIVSSFEDLSDQSSRSYIKRATILETVAKVRSCVVMLDLECDALITEMFQHFLKAIRDYHPDNVFSSMETIMTLVLEESESISSELLTPILATVKKDESVLPIARKLGEEVLKKAAEKLKPYLAEAVKSMGYPLEDYSEIVSVICNATSAVSEQNDDNASGQLAEEVKIDKASSDESAEVAKEGVSEGPSPPEEASSAVDRSPKSVMSNGISEKANEETSVDQESLTKPEQDQSANESVDVNLTNKVDNDDSDAGKSIESESKTEQAFRREEGQSNCVTNIKEPSDSFQADSEKESEKVNDRLKSGSKDGQSSLGGVPIEADAPSETNDDAETLPLSPKELEVETTKATASSPSRSLPDESRVKKNRRSKKKHISTKVVEPSADVSTKAPEGTSELAVKKKHTSNKVDEPSEDVLTKAPEGTSELAVKKKQTSTKVDEPSADVSTKAPEGTSELAVKKKQTSTKVDEPSADVSTKAPEGTSELAVKRQKRSGRKVPAGTAKEDKVPGAVVIKKSQDESVSGSEEKTPKQVSKKVESDNEDETPLRQTVKKVKTGDSKAKTPKQVSKKMESDEDEKPLRQTAKKGDTGDPEAKPLKQSGKKGVKSLESKLLVQSEKKGEASNSEGKAQKQSGKKVSTNHSVEDKSSSKNKEVGIKRGRGQDATEKDLAKSDPEDEKVSSPKPTMKSAKEEDHFEEPNTTNSKRKRTSGKEKASETVEYGDNIVGSKIKVWWPKDHAFYDGVIESYDATKKKHTVLYTDGEVEVLNLKREKWEFREEAPMSDGEQAADDSSPNDSSEIQKMKKKAKTDVESSSGKEAMDISPKRVGATSSNKSKASAPKSSRKSKVEDTKSKDNTSKSGNKTVDHSSVKSKDKSHKGSGKSVDATPVPKSGATDSKDAADIVTPKTNSKSKQESSSKTVNKSKGKINANNGSGKKAKSSSLSKVLKESDDEKENSVDSERTTEELKEKSPETTSKVPESGAKSGKKRKKRT